MPPNHPAEDPDQPIGFRWRDLFPDPTPERHRTPRERDLLLTTIAFFVLATFVAAFFGRFLGMDTQASGTVDYWLSGRLFLGIMGPFIICALGLWISIKRFREQKIAWPVPLYGIAALVLNFALGLLLTVL